ncbi:MAG: hypothetical protein L6Q40_06240 [Azonexus sp.]|nr:hypothetical protein [Azonexus sp.]
MRVRDDTPPTPRGLRIALLFALVAERLNVHYEHGQWLTVAQGTALAADWLARNRQTLPLEERATLSRLSDDFARQTATTLSRQAGLLTTHEMMQALDPNYRSELAEAMMAACARLLDDLTAAS